MPLIETKGAASAQGFGGAGAGASGLVTYIEDVFSTYLYTGNGSTQTITNGIDLSGKGGLVWIKQRSSPVEDWRCVDSARGITNGLQQNLTNAQQDWTGLGYVTSFNTNGFSIGTNVSINTSAYTYASWTFRKQPKFFDIVTYTGNGVNGRNIPHSLGSAPGFIVVKVTSATGDWVCWHRSLGTNGILLNSTAASAAYTSVVNFLSQSTSANLIVGTNDLNANGATYVAYLFAHDAGGFGLSGSENVISCGSFTTDGSGNATVNLGYEPQWVLYKRSSGGLSDWLLLDSMRDMSYTTSAILYPNVSAAESSGVSPSWINATATGFGAVNGRLASGNTYIYIAIRRGPMKVPTSGTSVFNPLARSGNSTTTTITSPGFAPDSVWVKSRSDAYGWYDWDKLRGVAAGRLQFNTTGAEQGSSFDIFTAFTNTGYTLGPDTASGQVNTTGSTYINYALARAPGFFDVVCYTGTGANATQAHNLSAVPQMMIVKKRSATSNWAVYHSALGAVGWILLNSSAAASSGADFWQSTTPTAVNFYTGTNGNVGDSGQTYVAYLFATCAGVSKVGSYTGTGALQTVDCGFAAGARFVLIKRTDSTGDWYVYDSARGISSGNDPYLFLNSTAAEVTGTNYVDTTSVGFQVTAAAPAGLNANGGSFVFLAIA